MSENKTMMINDTAVIVKEYKGKRVVTLKEIDQCHGRPDGTARKRFNDNKVRFIEGVDYFKVPYDEVIESPPGGRSIFDIPNEIEGFRGIDYSGFIYIVQDVNNGYWKIGRTSSKKAVEKRLNLSRIDNLKNYQYFECVDTLRADKIIRDELKIYNVKNSWYDCSVDLIVEKIKDIVSKVSATHEPRKKHKGGFHGNITFITESGYLMLVKSFTDDLAWDVQRQLVNLYFRNQNSTSTEIKVCDESTDKIIDAYLPQADEPTRMLLRATFMAMNNLSNQVGALKTENKALEAENTKKENIIQENQPKVDFAEGITASKGTISMSQFAKMVSKETGKTIGRNAILLWLRQQKILMRTNEPYQMYKKYFEYIPVLNHWGKGGFATRVTGKGQQWLFERLRKAGVIGEKKNTKLVSVSVAQDNEDDYSWVDEI